MPLLRKKEAGLDAYYADHGKGIYPINGEGVPFSANILLLKEIQSSIYMKT